MQRSGSRRRGARNRSDVGGDSTNAPASACLHALESMWPLPLDPRSEMVFPRQLDRARANPRRWNIQGREPAVSASDEGRCSSRWRPLVLEVSVPARITAPRDTANLSHTFLRLLGSRFCATCARRNGRLRSNCSKTTMVEMLGVGFCFTDEPDCAEMSSTSLTFTLRGLNTVNGQLPDVRAPRELAARRVDAGNFSGTACRDGRTMEEAAVQTDRSSRRSKETTR